MACSHLKGNQSLKICTKIDSLYLQNEFEGGRRAFIRGRIAYDEANERFPYFWRERRHMMEVYEYSLVATTSTRR